VVLDPLGVLLSGLGRHADRHQQVHHHAVARPHSLGQPLARLGQEQPAIAPRHHKPFALQPRDRLDRGGV